MSKLKQPVELTAAIYNGLVKVFNDAANGITRDGFKDEALLKCRDQIIAARKEFPTYQELKDSGIKFVDGPIYIDEVSKEEVECKSWIGRTGECKGEFNNCSANILDASVVYCIEFMRSTDAINFQPTVLLKVRGTPSPERFGAAIDAI